MCRNSMSESGESAVHRECSQEIAVAGGTVALFVAEARQQLRDTLWIVKATIPRTFGVVYIACMAVIVSGARGYRLGNVGARRRSFLRKGRGYAGRRKPVTAATNSPGCSSGGRWPHRAMVCSRDPEISR
jgi:hypothetical protein